MPFVGANALSDHLVATLDCLCDFDLDSAAECLGIFFNSGELHVLNMILQSLDCSFLSADCMCHLTLGESCVESCLLEH